MSPFAIKLRDARMNDGASFVILSPAHHLLPHAAATEIKVPSRCHCNLIETIPRLGMKRRYGTKMQMQAERSGKGLKPPLPLLLHKPRLSRPPAGKSLQNSGIYNSSIFRQRSPKIN